MNRLPLFAYNLMRGKWEVFPWQMLSKMPNGKLGFTHHDLDTRREYSRLYNEYWYSFEVHLSPITNASYYTIKDQPDEEKATDLGQEKQ